MQTRITQRLRGRPAGPVTVEFKRKRKAAAAAAPSIEERLADRKSGAAGAPAPPQPATATHEPAAAARAPRVLKPIAPPVWTTNVVAAPAEEAPPRARRGRPAKAGRDTFGGLRRLLGDRPFPAAFADPDKPLPLALDAEAELAGLAEEQVAPDRKTLALARAFLRYWTGREPYLRAVAAPGSQRFGLDGSWSGAVTAEQRAAARTRLEGASR